MAKYNIHVSSNKKQTSLIATIRDEKGEVLKEFYEAIGPLGAKTHQKLLKRTCIDWVNYEYVAPVDVPSISESTSGAEFISTSEAISGANI